MKFLCKLRHNWAMVTTSKVQIVSFGVPGISKSIARQAGKKRCTRCLATVDVVKHGEYNTLVDKYFETDYRFIGTPKWRSIRDNSEEKYWQQNYEGKEWNKT